MKNTSLWFVVSFFGTVTGGALGSFLGLLVMGLLHGTPESLPYSKYGFYLFALFGAHMAVTITLNRVDPDANAATKLRVVSVFGGILPGLFLLACRAIQG